MFIGLDSILTNAIEILIRGNDIIGAIIIIILLRLIYGVLGFWGFGVLGTLLTAVFAAESMGGLGLETSIGSQFVTQSIGVIATIAWCGVISFVLFKILDAVIGLRVTEDEETEGLDIVLHNERGYTL